jgi:hypothetical protein
MGQEKIPAPIKPITAAIVSKIANALYATARQKTAATLHSQKDFRAPTHYPIDRGLCATDVHRPVIQRQIWDYAPKNLAWREKPKHWRTFTRPGIRFFSKVVSCDPWLGLRLSRIVGDPGYPAHQPGPGRGRSLFAGKNIVMVDDDSLVELWRRFVNDPRTSDGEIRRLSRLALLRYEDFRLQLIAWSLNPPG